MRWGAFASASAFAFCTAVAWAQPSPGPRSDGPPYRLWWSLPLDDDNAIEVDESEISSASRFGSRWQLAVTQGCHAAPPRIGIARGGDPVLRELKVETLDGAGKVRTTRRCVRTMAEWKKRLGRRLLERLEDELDAHISFLHPRHTPEQQK
jgi:hypothetical protein